MLLTVDTMLPQVFFYAELWCTLENRKDLMKESEVVVMLIK